MFSRVSRLDRGQSEVNASTTDPLLLSSHAGVMCLLCSPSLCAELHRESGGGKAKAFGAESDQERPMAKDEDLSKNESRFGDDRSRSRPAALEENPSFRDSAPQM
jgi:hypothetical protein